MKQVLQDVQSGELLLEEIPCPEAPAGQLLIRTTRSLISSGTERSAVDFARGNYISKIKQKPEKVQQVLAKLRTDGVGPTLQAVRAKLEQPLTLGYSNVGEVIAVGAGVTNFSVGDRVVSNGNHAEIVSVPEKLCAKIPGSVSDEQAVFTVIASIALHGIRLLKPTLGERVSVVGLGLVGLVAVQLLRNHGVKVIGFDFVPERLDLAREFGATAIDLSTGVDPIESARAFSQGIGVDAALVTAATKDDGELMHQVAESCRARGRIVLTGVTGLALRRSDFYEKELDFKVSCSYGPGRYDPSYEFEGNDYPISYVRWTEQRNFAAILELLEEQSLNFNPLISKRVPFIQAGSAYDALSDKHSIGILLEYPSDRSVEELRKNVVAVSAPRSSQDNLICAAIGAGNFAKHTLFPILSDSGAKLSWVASQRGINATLAAKKFGFEKSTTEINAPLNDEAVNAVVISTRHDTHARFVTDALRARKSVFVEKPLCIEPSELEEIESVYQAEVLPEERQRPILMVNFNRRFSPLTELISQKISERQSPLALTFTCNAGPIPAEHWVHDPQQGGGRLVGEVCHFIDLLYFLVGAPIRRISGFKTSQEGVADLEDTLSLTLSFEDGSIGNINYFANGSKKLAKERLSVFNEGRVLELLNFKELRAYGFRGFKGKKLMSQDKGHGNALNSFLTAVKEGKDSPISYQSLVHSTRATFAALQSIREEHCVEVM